jgi:hypothetical protein
LWQGWVDNGCPCEIFFLGFRAGEEIAGRQALIFNMAGRTSAQRQFILAAKMLIFNDLRLYRVGRSQTFYRFPPFEVFS